MLTSPAAPIAPRVFNMAQDENGDNESETRVETSQNCVKFKQTLMDSFSAVSTPNFASKYSLESSWRDLQDLHLWSFMRLLHTFAPLRFQNFSQKSSTFFSPINQKLKIPGSILHLFGAQSAEMSEVHFTENRETVFLSWYVGPMC